VGVEDPGEHVAPGQAQEDQAGDEEDQWDADLAVVELVLDDHELPGNVAHRYRHRGRQQLGDGKAGDRHGTSMRSLAPHGSAITDSSPRCRADVRR